MNYTLLSGSLTVLMAAGPVMWLIIQAVISSWKSEDEQSVRNSVSDFLNVHKLAVGADDAITTLRRCGAELRATPDRVTGARHWQLFLTGVYLGGWVCWITACALTIYVDSLSLHKDALVGPHWLLGVGMALAITTFLGTMAFASLYNVIRALSTVVNPRQLLGSPDQSKADGKK
jgi:hypothetical protein